MRIVLDTNVIIAGFFWQGSAKTIFAAIEDDEFELCLTRNILDEVKRVLQYPKFERHIRRAGIGPEKLLDGLLAHSLMFEDVELATVVAEDPSDDMFINCALLSGVKRIISGDKHLLRIGSFMGIRIVTPATFVRERR